MIDLWSVQYVVILIIFRPLYLFIFYELYSFTEIFWVENWSAVRRYRNRELHSTAVFSPDFLAVNESAKLYALRFAILRFLSLTASTKAE